MGSGGGEQSVKVQPDTGMAQMGGLASGGSYAGTPAPTASIFEGLSQKDKWLLISQGLSQMSAGFAPRGTGDYGAIGRGFGGFTQGLVEGAYGLKEMRRREDVTGIELDQAQRAKEADEAWKAGIDERIAATQDPSERARLKLWRAVGQSAAAMSDLFPTLSARRQELTNPKDPSQVVEGRVGEEGQVIDYDWQTARPRYKPGGEGEGGETLNMRRLDQATWTDRSLSLDMDPIDLEGLSLDNPQLYGRLTRFTFDDMQDQGWYTSYRKWLDDPGRAPKPERHPLMGGPDLGPAPKPAPGEPEAGVPSSLGGIGAIDIGGGAAQAQAQPQSIGPREPTYLESLGASGGAGEAFGKIIPPSIWEGIFPPESERILRLQEERRRRQGQ